MLLCNTDEDPAKQRNYLGVLVAERVAGAIISPTDTGTPKISGTDRPWHVRGHLRPGRRPTGGPTPYQAATSTGPGWGPST